MCVSVCVTERERVREYQKFGNFDTHKTKRKRQIDKGEIVRE